MWVWERNVNVDGVVGRVAQSSVHVRVPALAVGGIASSHTATVQHRQLLCWHGTQVLIRRHRMRIVGVEAVPEQRRSALIDSAWEGERPLRRAGRLRPDPASDELPSERLVGQPQRPRLCAVDLARQLRTPLLLSLPPETVRSGRAALQRKQRSDLLLCHLLWDVPQQEDGAGSWGAVRGSNEAVGGVQLKVGAEPHGVLDGGQVGGQLSDLSERSDGGDGDEALSVHLRGGGNRQRTDWRGEK